MSLKYKRVLLKISGEALAAEKSFGIDGDFLKRLSSNIKKASDLGAEIAIVVGGGNFFRGRNSEGMDRVTADHMGMLATTINALALSDALLQQGAETRVMTAIEMRQIAEPYIRKRALRHLEKSRIVIFAGGTGSPFFSTDSAMALRAAEIGADLVLKATNVDGVYDKDPKKFPEAVMFKNISHLDVLQKQIQVMDANAAAICRDNGLRILVFNLGDGSKISEILEGHELGTLVG